MSDTGDAGPQEKWHVTRGVPVALIVSLAIFMFTQTGTAAWFAARLDARIDVLEKAQALAQPQGERLTRVEEKLENVKTGIADIKIILQASPRDKR